MGKKLKDTYHKIGELLVRKKLAPVEAIDDALAIQRSAIERKQTPEKLGEILVKRSVLTRKLIDEILQEQQIGRGQKKTLKVGLRDAGGISIVTLDGRLDESKTASVTKVFERLMNRGFSRILVDARKLVYLNSHGISTFVSYVDEARARGGDLKFYGLTADARIVLERLGLMDFIQTFPTMKEALPAFALPIDEFMSRGALAEFISTAKSRTYHLSYCSSAQSIEEVDRNYYESKWHARRDKKTACKRCKP